MGELEGMDEQGLEKEARSSALQEVLDLLTRLEMKQHAPPEAAPVEEAPPELEPEVPEMGALEGAEGEGSGSLSPEDIEQLLAKLESMKG